jgi:SLA1 homology domain 1, SHD1
LGGSSMYCRPMWTALSHRTQLIAFALALLTLHPFAAAREWTDNTGQYKRTAEFVRRDGANVVLERENGGETHVSWNRLSAADQMYIEELMAGLEPPSAPPASQAVAQRGFNGVMRFANFQQTDVPTEEDTRNYDVQGTTRALRKYIYCGCGNGIRLVGMYGTAAYYFYGGHYLAYLVRDSTREQADPNYFYYLPLFGDPRTSGWALSRWPIASYGRYAVYRHNGDRWVFFGCYHRERPM